MMWNNRPCRMKWQPRLCGQRGRNPVCDNHRDFFLLTFACIFPTTRKSVHKLHYSQVQDRCQKQHLNFTLNYSLGQPDTFLVMSKGTCHKINSFHAMLHSGTYIHNNFKAHATPLKHAYSQMIVRSFNVSRLHWVFKISSAACLALSYLNTSVLVWCGACSN